MTVQAGDCPFKMHTVMLCKWSQMNVERSTKGAPREFARSGYEELGKFTARSQKHLSAYLHKRETNLFINESSSSVSVPLSVSVSLLSLSTTSYMHEHTTRERLEVGLYSETIIVFSNCIMRKCIFTLPFRSSNSVDFSWLAHCRLVVVMG
jgi:hypothetical protein